MDTPNTPNTQPPQDVRRDAPTEPAPATEPIFEEMTGARSDIPTENPNDPPGHGVGRALAGEEPLPPLGERMSGQPNDTQPVIPQTQTPWGAQQDTQPDPHPLGQERRDEAAPPSIGQQMGAQPGQAPEPDPLWTPTAPPLEPAAPAMDDSAPAARPLDPPPQGSGYMPPAQSYMPPPPSGVMPPPAQPYQPLPGQGTGQGPLQYAPPAGYPMATPPHDWLVTLLLCVFGGGLGLHRFYTGRIATGIIMLLTLGGCGVWTIIDIVMIVAGSYTDAQGRPLMRRVA